MYQSSKANEIAMCFVPKMGVFRNIGILIIHAKDGKKQTKNFISFAQRWSNEVSFVFPLWWTWVECRPTHYAITLLFLYISFHSGDFNPIFNGGKLTQQFIVDDYCKTEANNLHFIVKNQKQIRVELYAGLADFVQNRAHEKNVPAGKLVILHSLSKGPRWMLNRYLNAMAVVGKLGKPDLFLTITCNRKWNEIQRNLRPFEKSHDRPDLVARVSNLNSTNLSQI